MKLDDKASEWLDGRLEQGERARFLRDLDADPDKAAEVKDLERVVEALRQLPSEPAPPDLMRDIQRRIRRRSHGRHFAGTWRQRLPFEALLNGLLVLVMVAFYVWLEPGRPTLAPVSPKVFQGAGSGAGLAGSVLSYYGLIVGESVEDGGRVVRLTVEVPSEKVSALLAELALYPELQVERALDAAGAERAFEAGSEPGLVAVHVRAPRGR